MTVYIGKVYIFYSGLKYTDIAFSSIYVAYIEIYNG